MPYYVYKIHPGASPLVKNLELQQTLTSFKDAKALARVLRAEQKQEDESRIKVIFADNTLEAEERLQEAREAPILREWEK
jgi:hypothetical protein